MADDITLRRSLGLPLIFLYGLGTTIGAGIYALTGTVAGLAGMQAPVSFGIAALLATFTAMSFAEFSSRHPRSAGEAIYVREGTGSAALATTVGLLVMLSGTVSSATMATAFVGYLGELVRVPPALAIIVLSLALGSLAAWGIEASVRAAALVTIAETGGLLLIVWAARGELAELPTRAPELLPALDPRSWGGILTGSVLAFYAFLGFEDMVNVAEEVRDVRRILPAAILLTLAVTLVIYVVVVTVAVLAVPPALLAASDAPLSLVYEATSGRSGSTISVIGLLAVVNGSLIQLIMSSRVLYGLASQGALPAVLSRVHPRTRTPMVATALVTVLVIVLALWLPLTALAAVTSVITLAVFTVVNFALVRVKARDPHPVDVWTAPSWAPVVGFVVSFGFLVYGSFRLAAGL